MFNSKGLLTSDQQGIAVVDGRRECTFGEFVSIVVRFVSYLQRNRIAKALIDLPQGVEGYASIWACYFSGTTFCPIPSGLPKTRYLQIQNSFSPDITLNYDKANSILNDRSENKPVSIDSLNDLPLISPVAYVIFTSGSTGTPKGVVVAREALVNFLNWSCKEYRLTSQDRWGQYSSLGFDLSICDIFTCLSQGATLVTVADGLKRLFPARVIEANRITVWHSVPCVVDLMMQGKEGGRHLLHSLRIISFCGDRLFPYQLEWLFSENDQLLVYNNYGPTEGTIYCTTQKICRETYLEFCRDTVSIGCPIPGYCIRTEPDSFGDLEIIISSPFIANGYLVGDFDGRFFTWEVDGHSERRYRTGDYVEVHDGQLYFAGRKDGEVKVNGHRVNLNEIDTCIRRFVPSTPCLSVLRDGRIVTYVQSCQTDLDEALMNYLIDQLPVFCLPFAIVLVGQFPYTQNQKIDINQLYSYFQQRRITTHE